MINLSERDFIEKIKHEKQHYKYTKIPKSAHFNMNNKTIGDFENFNGVVASSGVSGAYLSRINPGAHLNKVVNKFNDMEVMTDIRTHDEIDPSLFVDEMIRYCELYRQEDVIAVQDDTNDLIMGIVTNGYSVVQNCDIYTLTHGILESNDITYKTEYRHDGFQMQMNVIFPDRVVELDPVDGKPNEIELRMSIFNGMTGTRALGINVGSWEQICTNGAMGLKSLFEWKQSHINTKNITAVNILERFTENLVKQLGKGDRYLELIEKANKITEPVLRENQDIIKFLTGDKFKLLKREAEEVFLRMKHHKSQYSRRTGFDIGRAVAEVARDTHVINRRHDLEIIAGNMMLMQVAS
jgi:hypothetical protein